VDKVMPVLQQHLRYLQRVRKVAVPDKVVRSHDRYPPFPYVLRFGKLVQQLPPPVVSIVNHQVCSKYVRRGQVHKVPIVHLLYVV
jgi:hypothetical protein